MGMDVKSPVFIARVATVVLGIIVLGIGLHSHFQSAWTNPGTRYAKPYESCKYIRNVTCPSISMERYYVAMIIICFIISVAGLIASFLMDLRPQPFKLVDMGYHAVAAVLLFIAAIVYMVSANQIHSAGFRDDAGWKFRRGEKIAAGVFTLFQTALYGVTAFLIARQ